MTTATVSTDFTHWVHKALASLYDPSVLGASPLVEVLLTQHKGDPASALQAILLAAIESLRPQQGAPIGSRAWRVYQILRARYTEQLPQPRVASDLGLSIRQLQREEALARNVLADHLWMTCSLAAQERVLNATQPRTPGRAAQSGNLTRAQELATLASSLPVRMTDVAGVLQAVLRTIAPLAQSSHVSLSFTAQPDLPRIPLQEPLLRQALLIILDMAIGCASAGTVQVTTQTRNNCLYIHVAGRPAATGVPSPQIGHDSVDVDMARQLTSLCRGVLEGGVCREETSAPAAGHSGFDALMTFRIHEQVTTLIIDDNADALKLFERYLSGSRYRFVGVQDARRALAVALKSQPQIVVLDVMMPNEDGWTLLGTLREHPKTRHIPVIVCTIMTQKDLALALGAAEFLRKPISQADLLAALDRQVDRAGREYHSET